MLIRVAAVGLLIASAVRAVDVEGVLPASMDQPRIYVAIAKDAKSPPLSAKGGGGMGDLLAGALGEKPKKHDSNAKAANDEPANFGVEAFLDTGASGLMFSKTTADALGLVGEKGKDGQPIRFHDVGVGGGEAFAVTAPMVIRTSDYGSTTEGDSLATYAPPLPNVRINVREEAGLMDELTGGLDVAGMPLMAGKAMVVDCRPLAKYEKLRTSLVPSGESATGRNPSGAPTTRPVGKPAGKTIITINGNALPAVDSTINLTYVDFTRFTQMEPAGAPQTTLAANPMIGPNPFLKTDPARPVTITHGGKTATLTMLLDTGAASSMISVKKARELGIVVDDSGKLTNVPPKQQFMLPIGGIGGQKNVNGFFVDTVVLPVTSGEPIRYVKAPVLVLDIDVQDEKTGETYTLDGVFGMNYLVASASVSMGLTGGGVDDMHDGAFDGFVIDHAKKTLGLQLKK